MRSAKILTARSTTGRSFRTGGHGDRPARSMSIATGNPSGSVNDAAATVATSTLPPILEIDASGQVVKSLGAGLYQDGKYLTEWKQFGMPGGLCIDRNDNLYVADSLSSAATHPGWIRGIRIGSAKDGTITAFIADPTPAVDPVTAAEGVAADAAGNVYGAVVGAERLQKHVRK